MISGGPNVTTDGLKLALDAYNAKSYFGNPITNMAYNELVLGQGSTWEAITSVPTSEGQTDWAKYVNFPRLNDKSIANSFNNANGKIFRNYVNNPALTDDTIYNNNGGFRCTAAIDFPSGLDSGYIIISFWCYLVTGYQGYSTNGLGSAYMQFNDSGGSYTGNGSLSRFVDGVSKTASETFNADTGRWKFVQLRFTKPANSTAIRNFYIYSDRNTQGEMYVCQLQIEDRSDGTDYQIPYVENTLSETGAWKSLVDDFSGDFTNGVSGSTESHFMDGGVIFPPTNAYIDFNGDTDSGAYVNLTPVAYDLNNTFTILSWINLDANQTGNVYGSAANGSDNFFGVNTGPTIRCLITEEANLNNTAVDGSTTLSLNTWYMIGTTVNLDTVKVYLNGVEDGTSTVAFTIGAWNNSLARVGRRTNSTSTWEFDGKIQTVYVYDKVLSEDEIYKIYNETKGRFNL